MTTWRYIDSGPCDAAFNMALDEAIAEAVRKGDSPPTLRLYGWRLPAVSLGAFQKITDVDADYCAVHKVQVVRRPTGGRGILHGEELTYSFSAKNEGIFSHGLLEAYRCISNAFSRGLERQGLSVVMKVQREKGRNLARSPLCFQAVSYGELTVDGRKLIGSAQKRWEDGFLQQGSIPYAIDYGTLAAVFLQHFPPGVSMPCLKELIPHFSEAAFKEYIKKSFEALFGVSLLEDFPADQEVKRADHLRLEKYENPLWTMGGRKEPRLCSNKTERRA